MDEEKKFCCRCKEDGFPIAKEPAQWQMGQMRLLKKAPLKIKKQLKEWLDSEIWGEGYLCGNCYFDMTD